MAIVPLPEPGDQTWSDWGTWVHDLVVEIESGRLSQASLDAAYSGGGSGGRSIDGGTDPSTTTHSTGIDGGTDPT